MEKTGIAAGSAALMCKQYTCDDLSLVQKWLKMSPMYVEEMEAMYPICLLLEAFVLDKDSERTKEELLDDFYKISSPKTLFNAVARSSNDIYKRANQLLKNQGYIMDPELSRQNELCVLKVIHRIYLGKDNRDLRISARTIIEKEPKRDEGTEFPETPMNSAENHATQVVAPDEEAEIPAPRRADQSMATGVHPTRVPHSETTAIPTPTPMNQHAPLMQPNYQAMMAQMFQQQQMQMQQMMHLLQATTLGAPMQYPGMPMMQQPNISQGTMAPAMQTGPDRRTIPQRSAPAEANIAPIGTECPTSRAPSQERTRRDPPTYRR